MFRVRLLYRRSLQGSVPAGGVHGGCARRPLPAGERELVSPAARPHGRQLPGEQDTVSIHLRQRRRVQQPLLLGSARPLRGLRSPALPPSHGPPPRSHGAPNTHMHTRASTGHGSWGRRRRPGTHAATGPDRSAACNSVPPPTRPGRTAPHPPPVGCGPGWPTQESSSPRVPSLSRFPQ